MNYLTSRQYLGYILMAIVGYLSFGPFDYYFLEDAPEGPWDRAPVGIMMISGLIYVLRNWYEPKKTIFVLYAMQPLTHLHYFYLIYKSGVHPYYVAGNYLVVLVCTTLILHKRYLKIYLIIAYIVSIWIFSQSPDQLYFVRTSFLFSFYTVFLYIFQNERIKILTSLDTSLKDLKSSKKQIEQTYTNNLQAAHDLASPISAINLAASKLKDENGPLHSLLSNSVTRINEISNNLLKTHRDSRLKVESDFFDIENSISTLVKEKRDEFSGIKDLTIFYSVTSPVLGSIKIPKIEFQRVLSNIINNAVEAMESNPQKRLRIVISPLKDQVEILISDNGCGVPPENQLDIFLDNVSFKEKGNGLGLSHAKKTLESWSGSIQLKSSDKKGSTFRICLPFS